MRQFYGFYDKLELWICVCRGTVKSERKLMDEKLDLIIRERTFRDEQGRVKLECRAAFEIAAQHDCSIADIGRICQEQKIKICSCQLGCFGR